MNINLKGKNNKIKTQKKILLEMLSNPGKTYSREIRNISGIIQERSIDVMITRLR